MHIPHLVVVAVYFFVILGIMVLVHEFGHFLVAKLCGVRVEAFSIGMGKRLFGWVHNGTDYKVCLLPLGGYVKMAGEADMEMIQTGPEVGGPLESDTPANIALNPATDPGNFNSKPRWQRMLIALAGPFANFLLAIVLFTLVAHFHYQKIEYLQDHRADVDYVAQNSPAAKTGIQTGDVVVQFAQAQNPSWEDIDIQGTINQNQTVPFAYVHDGKRVDTTLAVQYTGKPEEFDSDQIGLVPREQAGPIVVDALPDATAPAAQAGLKNGDSILAIDGHAFHGTLATGAYLKDGNGRPVALTVLHGGRQETLHVTPRLSPSQDGTEQYRLGFGAVPPPMIVRKQPLDRALATGWDDFAKNSVLIVEVIRGMFTHHVSVRSMSGPVGIAEQVGIAQEMGTWAVLSLMGGISVNLGLLNLFPFPILDGGLLLFLFIESIMRRDVNQAVKERIYQAAFVCILIFAVLVIFNDISKLPLFAHKG